MRMPRGSARWMANRFASDFTREYMRGRDSKNRRYYKNNRPSGDDSILVIIGVIFWIFVFIGLVASCSN